ncbi:MAG: endolytic transglycosylase MltG [Rubrobacter sp.]|nr:endolytic transglycosylase MltG [Rubrobacter sp.]
MSRYDRGTNRDLEEVDERLLALREPSRRRKKRDNRGPTILSILLIAGICLALYFIYTSATVGEQETSNAPITVTVVEGDTLESVAAKLKKSGIIASSSLFELEARVNGQTTQLKPGKYRFRPGTDAEKILVAITAGDGVPLFAITIPEGLTIEQTADLVAQNSRISANDFEMAARTTDYGYAFLENPHIHTAEGFLFPKRYEFEQGTSASQVVNRLLEQYLLETQNLDLGSARQRLGLSEYEILTVASLVEREAAKPDERRRVASVIYNRLHKDIPLQIDATIQYARGKPKEDLSLDDLKIKSPYNTYENTGLPPGPICSPGRDSLEAAMQPADTDYLYYVLKSGGQEHFFTRSYDEFLKAKAKAGR